MKVSKKDKEFHEEIKKRNTWIDFDLVDNINGQLPKINDNEVVLVHRNVQHQIMIRDMRDLKATGVSKSDNYEWWNRYMIIKKPMGFDNQWEKDNT